MTITTMGAARRSALTRLAYGLASPLAATAGLSGCATPTTLRSDSVLPSDGGLVTLRVVNLLGHALDKLTIRHDAMNRAFEMTPQASMAGQSVYFTGMLPAGRCSLGILNGRSMTHIGKGEWVERQFIYPLARKDLVFDVEASTLSNLGTLVLVPVTTSVSKQRYFVARDPAPLPAREWLETAHPDLAHTLKTGERGWAGPVFDPTLNDQALTFAAAMAPLHSKPRWLGDGSFWRGGCMGSLQRVAPTLRSERILTGSTDQLLAVLPFDDGRVLVAGESRRVAVSSPDRKSWRPVPVPESPTAAGVSLERSPEGDIYLVMQAPSRVSVWKSGPQDIRWQAVHRFERKPERGNGEDRFSLVKSTPPQACATATAQHLMVYVPDPPQFATMSWTTGQWNTSPVDVRLAQVHACADGTVHGAASEWNDNFVSTDSGQTWRKTDKFVVHQSNVVFADRARAYVIATSGLNLLRAVGDLYRSVDAGASWQVVGKAPVVDWRAGQLAYDAVRQRLIFLGEEALMSTTDDGASWQTAV